MQKLSDTALEYVANYFQALSEPTRLKLLNELRQGEKSVGELAQKLNFTPANISRQLSMLAKQGLVARTSQGNMAYYSIKDPSIFKLCDIVCDTVARQFADQSQLHRELTGQIV
ncbi:MAG TPA: metalloregulator ArsR/SmtB family transcription factor [Pseudomonadales bacterium]|nr:metalloregulator ArsR/SmtB family transcription factor [Pseudomonadales bacterium]